MSNSISLSHIHLHLSNWEQNTNTRIDLISHLTIRRAKIPESNSFIQGSRNKSIIHWRHWKGNHSATQKVRCIKDTQKESMKQLLPHQLCTSWRCMVLLFNSSTEQKRKGGLTGVYHSSSSAQAPFHPVSFSWNAPIHILPLGVPRKIANVFVVMQRQVPDCIWNHKQTISFITPQTQRYLTAATQLTCSPQQ